MEPRELDIRELRKLCIEGSIKWSLHAIKRLRERGISMDDFKDCILNGEIIRQYPDDRPTPSCLVLGWVHHGTALHVVIGCDGVFLYAITAYYPDLNEWEPDMKTRKER